jgi:hypothetical protein
MALKQRGEGSRQRLRTQTLQSVKDSDAAPKVQTALP